MRISTVSFQQTMRNAMALAQSKIADTQNQMNTGKKANDLAALGSNAVRTLTARSLLADQQAQSASAKNLGTTLDLYDTNITSIDTTASDLRTKLMAAIGSGQAQGLQSALEGAFSQVRSALNATDGASPLFAGSQTGGPPFKPATLADTVGATPATAFGNDDVRGSARVGDGVDVTYGVTASDLGTGMLAAFRTLAEAGPIGDKPTATQITALQAAVGQIDTALPQVRNVNATNGIRQAQVEALGTRADDRAALLTQQVSDNEDADWGQLSIDLAQQKLALQASYSAFGQISQLSLTSYLK
jgi:flagellar hook-associated protein 3 FlgL